MATTTSNFPLATESFTGTLPDSGPGSSQNGNDAGAEGSSSNGGFGLSHGGLVAIIVVVVVVAVLGISSATLFYLAKKREWKIRESIRRSARRVVTALTPRRSEFPKSVKDGGPRSKARMRLDDVPPTPKLRPEDLEKGLSVTSTTSSGGSRNKKDMRWK